jgi:hypothetical protein
MEQGNASSESNSQSPVEPSIEDEAESKQVGKDAIHNNF